MATSTNTVIKVDFHELMLKRKVAAQLAAREWKLMRKARNAKAWRDADMHHLLYVMYSARARTLREVMRM